MKHETKQKPARDKKNILEWFVFGISLLLTLTVIVFLAYRTLNFTPSPPQIEVSFTPDGNQSHRYHLVVRNTGGETAEAVILKAELKKNNQIVEKIPVYLEYVPHVSTRESWVDFENDPREADSVEIRVESFRKP